MIIKQFNASTHEFVLAFRDNDQIDDPIEQNIKSFENLQERWNYGEGSPSSPEMTKRALSVYHIGKGYDFNVDVYPFGEGEIEISFSKQDHFVDILLNRDGTADLNYEVGIGRNYETTQDIKNVSERIITDQLKDLAGLDGWMSSELCESNHFEEGRSDTTRTVFGTIEAAYRLLTNPASQGSTTLQYAST